jgi:lauroyl/myristoyl acyltransferase
MTAQRGIDPELLRAWPEAAAGDLYLRSALIVARSPLAARFLVLHPRSFQRFHTDSLGAEALRWFSLGLSAAAVRAFVEHRCSGAGGRWNRMVSRLFVMGSLTNRSPVHNANWWFRRLLALLLGRALSAGVGAWRHTPTRVLQRLLVWLPAILLERGAMKHLAPLIEANLVAGGYRDQPPAWRRSIARSVVRATLQTNLFSYLLYVLTPRQLADLLRAMLDVRGLEHIRRALDERQGAIVVGLHWHLFFAGVFYASTMGPVVQLSALGLDEQSLAAEETFAATPFAEPVDSESPLVIRTLVRRLRAGKIVMLTIDVGLPAGSERQVETIKFLHHDVPRYDTAAWLSVHTGRPIILAHPARKDGRLAVGFSPPILTPEAGTADERVRALSERLYAYADRQVREHPEAWLGWTSLGWLAVRSGQTQPPA